MAGLSIDKTRIVRLNDPATKQDGQCVLYVMSRDQRVFDNHALLAAQRHALSKQLPMAVLFVLKSGSGFRSREQYRWMLEGLREVEHNLSAKNIPFMLLIGDPFERLTGCMRHLKPDAVYFDMNPLRGPRQLQKRIAKHAVCPVFVVDTHNLVPVWIASSKQEIGARTLRPKIHRLIENYSAEPSALVMHPHTWHGTVMKTDELKDKISDVLELLPSNDQDLNNLFEPGESAARKRLKDFIDQDLLHYAELRNDPTKNALSGLSPYLHFGQLSSLRVLLEVRSALASNSRLQHSSDVLTEEMVVRKELSDNFCFYNPNYDNLSGAPKWAQVTLSKHRDDPRDFIYSRDEFEYAKTHDPAWNAAQNQLLESGKMHGYMRMYWAKKVLEWSKTPDEAIDTLIYLNDFYSIDGGDPNGYVGILWSVAGLHDRPWGERSVYGTVRSMVYNGLKRKFEIATYISENS